MSLLQERWWRPMLWEYQAPLYSRRLARRQLAEHVVEQAAVMGETGAFASHRLARGLNAPRASRGGASVVPALDQAALRAANWRST